MKLNTDVKNQYLEVNEFHTTLNEKHFKILNDIKRKLKDPSIDEILEYFGVTLIDTDKHCGGYCDYTNKIIAMNVDTEVDSFTFKSTLTHELSHIIQVNSGDIILLEDGVLLSDKFRLEQQCEAISYKLMPILFNLTYKMESYNNIESVLFLKNWYDKWFQNDLIIE